MSGRLLADVARRFTGLRVVVVGDVMLDEYIWGEVRRVSPEAPVPVVEIRRRSYVPGGAANAAANAASLGGHVLLGGAVGNDPQAAELRQTLAAAHVDAGGLVVLMDRPTTTKTRIVAHNQQIVRLDAEERGHLAEQSEEALLQWVESAVARADACILSDYAKGVVSARLAQRVIQTARQANTPVVIDPKGTDYEKYRGASVITPNVHEVERALNCEIGGDGAALIEAGGRLSAALDGGAVLITRGQHGMALFRDGALVTHIASQSRAVFDVTGAGDTVVSAMAMGLASGVELLQAAAIANIAAGSVVGKVGTASIQQQELIAVLDDLTDPRVGAHSEGGLTSTDAGAGTGSHTALAPGSAGDGRTRPR
jgi:rfaE bifunctional protein kinase chain/domain